MKYFLKIFVGNLLEFRYKIILYGESCYKLLMAYDDIL